MMPKKSISKAYDVILSPFQLTDLASQKICPALQLSDTGDEDIILCAISTKKHSSFDIKIGPTKANGLKRVSYIRSNKIATIEKRLALAKLGDLDTKSKSSVQAKLKTLFSI
jgi:mRNA interferase MazF